MVQYQDFSVGTDGVVLYSIIDDSSDGIINRAGLRLGDVTQDGVWTLRDNSSYPLEVLEAANRLWTPEIRASAEAIAMERYYAFKKPQIIPNAPMWAVRTILQKQGLFLQAEALIKASNDDALKNIWEYGNFADRKSDAMNSLAAALGLTKDQVDQMFIDANNLTV